MTERAKTIGAAVLAAAVFAVYVTILAQELIASGGQW